MPVIIQFANLTQTHQNQEIIDDLSFTVEEGEVFGLLGPNGAGKTTAIRIMTTLLVPTFGDVLIEGHSVKTSPELVRKTIGYVPNQCGFYADMTAWEYLDFFGACYKIRYRERTELISTLLELVDLSEQEDALVGDLSFGMKQKLSVARALLHDPKVLILDNPLSGLESKTSVEILQLLSELAQMGKTIFLSSHNLENVTKICNRVGIMDAGKLVAYGTVKELKTRLDLARTIRIKALGQPEYIQSLLKRNPYISEISINKVQPDEPFTTIRVKFQGEDEKIIELLTVLIRFGIKILSFEVDTSELEDVFLHITKGATS